MVRKVSGVKKRKGAVSGTKRKTHRRKRRISGTGDMMGAIEKAGGLVLGAVGGRELNTIAVKIVPTLSPMLSGALQAVVGYMLPKFIKGSFVAAVGDGMIANGGMVMLVSTGIINGPNNRMTYRVNGGTSNLKVIGGTSKLQVIGQAGSVNGFDTRISNQPANVPRVRLPQHYV
jgi:hypothetical protein